MNALEELVEQQEKVLNVLKTKRDQINDITNAVCHRFEISVAELKNESRHRKYVNPRAAFCYLIFKQSRHKYTLHEVGRMLDLHHATIINCLKNASNWMVSDKDFNERVKAAENDLSHLFVKLDVEDKISAVGVISELVDKVNKWITLNPNNPFCGYMTLLQSELSTHKKHLTND